MTEPGETATRKFSFLLISTLVAINLALLSIILASPNRPTSLAQFMSMPDSLRPLTSRVDMVVHALGSSSANKQSKKRASSSGLAINRTFAAIGDTVWGGVTALGRGVSGSLRAVTHAVGAVPRVAAKATDVKAFIKPADDTHVPVITTLPAATIAAIPVASSANPPTNAPAPQPKPVIKSVAATPSPPPVPQILTANTYAWGNCTYWAAERRAQVHDPIPNTWGNAATWAVRAARDGYVVNDSPSPGAIMQTADAAGGLGHVAFVESVDPNGTWHISEMNVLGLNVIDHKAEPASAAAYYHFIHDKG